MRKCESLNCLGKHGIETKDLVNHCFLIFKKFKIYQLISNLSTEEMLKVILATIFILGAFGSQDTPIPTKPDGYALGSTNPTLHIEAYFDLLCPDCRDSWNVLEPILRNEYNITTNQTLRFTIHLFPLPFHVNSFMVSQGAKVIGDNMKDIEDVFAYFNLILQNQESYYTAATLQFTQQQVQQNLTSLVCANLPQYAQIFPGSLQYGNSYDSQARVTWKYGTYKGVRGTPTFVANGIVIVGADNFNADDWRKFLNGSYQNRHISQ